MQAHIEDIGKMNKHNPNGIPHTTPRQSATFTQDVNSDIRRA